MARIALGLTTFNTRLWTVRLQRPRAMAPEFLWQFVRRQSRQADEGYHFLRARLVAIGEDRKYGNF